MTPLFTISLDFELHWGVRDHSSIDDYRANLLGVREAIPAILAAFARRDIAATWATVGFLFAETKHELERNFPRVLPSYADGALSPYEAMSEVGPDEKRDPFHFGASLLRQIAATPLQEIATHTFSHYYCLAPGQTVEQFEADLLAAAAIARNTTEPFKSLVFPRNQFGDEHIKVLERLGYTNYRGNPDHWAYRATGRETRRRRIFRLADTYLPLSRRRPAPPTRQRPVDVSGSAFFRPYSARLARLDDMRRWRLRESMTRAAREGRNFHLWWHPHNFGVNLRENVSFLELVLEDFTRLRRTYGMESVSMARAAEVQSSA